MYTYEATHQVGHRPEDMFALVADIERYPAFLPLCEGLRVVERKSRDGKEVLVARMTVGYKLIRENFTTEVTLDPAARTILVEYLDGPFSHLENRWRFDQADHGGCSIDFFIRYSFRSRMLEKLMGGLFAKAVEKYTDAFEARADKIYGRKRVAGPAVKSEQGEQQA